MEPDAGEEACGGMAAAAAAALLAAALLLLLLPAPLSKSPLLASNVERSSGGAIDTSVAIVREVLGEGPAVSDPSLRRRASGSPSEGAATAGGGGTESGAGVGVSWEYAECGGGGAVGGAGVGVSSPPNGVGVAAVCGVYDGKHEDGPGVLNPWAGAAYDDGAGVGVSSR